MKVYSMNISAIDPADEKWYKYLSKRRIEKVKKIKKPQKKAQSIGVELLLRRAVNEIIGENKNVLWDTYEGGKLYLTEYPNIYVNLSHSGNRAVCAVSDTPIGVDIQEIRECDMSLSKRFFTADETRYIRESSDSNLAFYEIWTKKESLLKAAGKGITVPLNSFSVLSDEIFYEGRTYKFKEYRIRDDGYKLFVCFVPSPE